MHVKQHLADLAQLALALVLVVTLLAAPQQAAARPQLANNGGWFGITSYGPAVSGGDPINDFAFDSSGNAVIVGNFTNISTSSGTMAAYDIARFDGSEWAPFGGTSNHEIFAIFIDGDDIYIGGNFTHVDNLNSAISAPGIAHWDGANWQSLAEGLPGSAVYTINMDSSGNLLVGGFITTADNGATDFDPNNIVMWDGSEWLPMAEGVDGAVWDIEVDGSEVYLGGDFLNADNGASTVTVNRVAHWDGSAYSALNEGVNSRVTDLQMYNSELHAAGSFTTADNGATTVTVNRIAGWDGSDWFALSGGLNNGATGMTVYNGDLVVHGVFTSAFNGATAVSANRLMRWDGSLWDNGLGSFGNSVYEMDVYNGVLYAAGYFTSATFQDTPYTLNKFAYFAADTDAPEVLEVQDGLGAPITDGDTLADAPDSLMVLFDEEMLSDGSSDAADNTANFLLYGAQNGSFETASCVGGVSAADNAVTLGGASWNSATDATTLSLPALAPDDYVLRVCGTATAEDPSGNALGGGTDFVLTFTVLAPPISESAETLPDSGFAPGQLTALGAMPTSAYSETAMQLSIPRLGATMDIVGVPQVAGSWDVSWLGEQAGWLAGSAFPTWQGNTVLTAHVWDANNQPGPFHGLDQLQHGDQFSVTAFGQTYVYEVRSNRLVRPTDLGVLAHSDGDVITLLTCESWDPLTQSYRYRRAVTAVLVAIH